MTNPPTPEESQALCAFIADWKAARDEVKRLHEEAAPYEKRLNDADKELTALVSKLKTLVRVNSFAGDRGLFIAYEGRVYCVTQNGVYPMEIIQAEYPGKLAEATSLPTLLPQ